MLHAFCWCAKDYRCLLITRWFLIQALYFSTTFIHWDLHRRDTIIQLLYLERNTLIWTIKRYTNIYWVSTIPGVIIILLLGLFLSIAPKQTYNSIGKGRTNTCCLEMLGNIITWIIDYRFSLFIHIRDSTKCWELHIANDCLGIYSIYLPLLNSYTKPRSSWPKGHSHRTTLLQVSNTQAKLVNLQSLRETVSRLLTCR